MSRRTACMYESSFRLRCDVPPSPGGSSESTVIAVTLYAGTKAVLFGKSLKYEYQAICPDSECIHGFCSQQLCSCLVGWTGDDCGTPILPPVLPILEDINLVEGVPYTSPSNQVVQGTLPIRWTIQGAPKGLRIGYSSGILHWDNPVARNTPYVITVRVANDLSQDSQTIQVFVPLSYKVSIGVANVNGRFTGERPEELVVQPTGYILLRGAIHAQRNGTSIQNQPIDIWLFSEKYALSTVRVYSSSTGIFQYYWSFTKYAVRVFISHFTLGMLLAVSSSELHIHLIECGQQLPAVDGQSFFQI